MSALKNKRLIVLPLLFLLVYGVYVRQTNASLWHEQEKLTNTAYSNQFFEGKACGLLTKKEATEILGTPVVTEGAIIPSESPTAQTRAGSPRVDSCAHTAIKSSDGYIDIILKTYSNKNDAAKYFEDEIKKLFSSSPREAGELGEKLQYGDGAFFLLKDTAVIGLSASKTPRVPEPLTEEFSRAILNKVVEKL